MKGLSLPLMISIVILFCSGCRNDSSRFLGMQTEKIDTSDCSSLVAMKPETKSSWLFETRKRLFIQNTAKPSIEFFLIKRKEKTNDELSDIILSLDVDSALCVDNGSYIFFMFADSTKFALRNISDNNCHGDFLASFKQQFNEVPGVENVVDMRKPLTIKLRRVRFGTHDGYRDYTLSDIEAANFQHLFNCIYKAK